MEPGAAATGAQELVGVEHWVEHAGIRVYVWEKRIGDPAGKQTGHGLFQHEVAGFFQAPSG